MRTTLDIDDALLREAAKLTGVKKKTLLVRLGPEALISRESARRLGALGGTEPQLRPVRRRRASRRIQALWYVGLLLLSEGAAPAQDRSTDYTAPYQQRALAIYRSSIGYRTAASHGQVPAFANYLADLFRSGGFAGEDVHVLPLTQPSGEETASLVVRYRGGGSSGRKPILLLAHMDVVDALPQDWERDPFTLTEGNGYFYGRGTLDDKFGTTMLTAVFLRLKAEGFRPTRDLILAFTGDEETEQATTRALVTTHRTLTDAEFALNVDAGGGVLDESGKVVSYLLQAAEKTYATFELTARNPGGHSSLPRADNAIYELARALQKIQAYRFPVQSNEITRRYFELTSRVRSGELAEAMRRFATNPNDEQAADILYGSRARSGLRAPPALPR